MPDSGKFLLIGKDDRKMNEKNAEITFPREWEYRIFCESAKCDRAEAAVRSYVADMGLAGLNLVAGGVSGSGTYRTLRLTVTVASKDEANRVGEGIKNIDGVRFIL